MPKWSSPEEELPGPEVDCGDRILMIVLERPAAGKAFTPRLVILEATEGGWDSPDPTYSGYTPEDGVLWTSEKDLCQIVAALGITRR